MDNVSSVIDGSIAAAGMIASLVMAVWALMDSPSNASVSAKKVEGAPAQFPKAA